MKKRKQYIWCFAIGVIALFTASFGMLHNSYSVMTRDYYEVTGSFGEDIALLLAANFKLTDAELDQLLHMDFKAAEQSPPNKRLREMVEGLSFSSEVKYVYVERKLTPKQVKYYVDKDTADFYEAPLGTPLDSVWLLDVLLAKEDMEKVATPQRYADDYQDVYRYSYLRPDFADLYDKQAPCHEFTKDEWGTLLSGFAPLYTVEGTFAGMLGVDFEIKKFVEYRQATFFRLLLAFVLTNLFVLFLFFLAYWAYKKEIKNTLYTDALTGVYNRKYMGEILSKRMASLKHPPAYAMVAMADLDHFKAINDLYGHLFGDHCLQQTAVILKEAFAPYPGSVIRFGGEEFLCVVAVKDQETAQGILEHCITRVRNIDMQGRAMQMTISMGACLIPYQQFLLRMDGRYVRKADQCMYHAKERGRDQYQLILCDGREEGE